MSQQSPEWLAWRSAGLGASDAGPIMGVDLYRDRGDILKSKAASLNKTRPYSPRVKYGSSPFPDNHPDDNPAQARGHRLEPVARDLYQELTGIQTRPVCVVHDDLAWLRASLDGLSLDDQIVLEIKAIKKDFHQLALAGEVPPQYVPQLQHQLLVTGLQKLHYWSYSESTWFKSRDRVALVTVVPDLDYQARLLEAEKAFWAELTGQD